MSTYQTIVSVNVATGDKFKPNKNGEMPLILNSLTNPLPPNSGVLDGSIAKRLNVEDGNRYAITITFRGYYKPEEFGQKYPNYDYSVVAHLGEHFNAKIEEQAAASFSFGAVALPQLATPTPTPEETPTPPPTV